MIICPICNKEMKCINSMHLKSHNLNMIEFKKKFPNYETHNEELRLKNKENSKKGIFANSIIRKEREEKILIDKILKFEALGKRCKQCNNLLNYTKDRKVFCNKSCSAKYNNLNRTIDFTTEGKVKQILSGKLNKKNLIDGSTRKGIRKYFNLNCCICKKYFQVTCEQKLNKTCSKECKSLLQSKVNHRENNTYGKSGYYQGVYCASSWELAFLIYNKDLGKDIKRCDLTFNYVMKDIEHTYFPDFLMDNIICEVKGRELEDVKFKTEAVIKAGYKIDVIRRKEILPIIKEIKTKYKVKDITQLYDLK